MTKSRAKKFQGKGRKNDEVYLPTLKALVDRLFQEAYDRKMDWNEMAVRSELSPATIHKLGNYETVYPQFRTIELLAYAVGGHVSFQQGKKAKSYKITWNIEHFKNKKKLKLKVA